MSTNFEDVGRFREKFGLKNVITDGVHPTMPRDGEGEDLPLRIKLMTEELREFVSAHEEGCIEEAADALIDLVYVAMGTAHLMGLPWQMLWEEVQACNMRKVAAARDGSNSKRGSGFDVVKPAGWRGPRIAEILESYGYGQMQMGC